MFDGRNEGCCGGAVGVGARSCGMREKLVGCSRQREDVCRRLELRESRARSKTQKEIQYDQGDRGRETDQDAHL